VIITATVVVVPQTDRSAREILPHWLPLLPAGPTYDAVRELLGAFDGGAWPLDSAGEDVADDYLLAQAWVFEVVLQVFAPLFPPGTPRFSVGAANPGTGLPTSAPNQRFAAMVALLSNPSTAGLLRHDWLAGRAWDELVVGALDTALQR
jgi:hypothetical protein